MDPEGQDDELIAPGDNVSRTKLELEIENHVLSTTVKLSDGTDGQVFSRIPRNKDLQFGYSCHICGVVCLHGERMLQIHMAGRKHQSRLNVAVFDAEQYRASLVIKAKGPGSNISGENSGSGDVPDRPPKEEESPSKPTVRLQNVLDGYRDGPLVGLEFIIELTDGNASNDPIYTCMLCNIDDNSESDITTHMISLQHRLKFLQKHYPTVRNVLAPFRNSKTDNGAQVFCRVVQTVCEAIEDHHGRLNPKVYDRGDFERNRVKYTQEIAFGKHFDERTGPKFVEVIDHKVLEDLAGSEDRSGQNQGQGQGQGAPKRYRNRNERGSLDSISSISSANSVLSISSSGDNVEVDRNRVRKRSPPNGGRPAAVDRFTVASNPVDYRRDRELAAAAAARKPQAIPTPRELSLQSAAIAHERYKWEKYRCTLELAVGQLTKSLKEFEKNPEKHPLYSEEWKKFWNRRYKELQLEKKDPQKHNFKPEWIEFWTKRMKELHDEEVERKKVEIRAKMQLPAEGEERTDELKEQYALRVPPGSSAAKRSRSVERKTDHKPQPTVLIDVNSDEEEDDYKGGQPSGGRGKLRASRRSEWDRDRSRHRSNSRSHRSRSPISDDNGYMDGGYSRHPYYRGGPPMDRGRSGGGGGGGEDGGGRAPERVDYDAWAKNYYGPNKTVFVRTEFDSDNVPLNCIAVCRLLTAFEEYLGSLGPKVIDLMSKALALEKVKANSADDLLLNEDNCMFLETVKEKLKGHMMAETIDASKMAPIKKAVRNIARLLHEASKREADQKPAEDEVSRDSLAISDVNVASTPKLSGAPTLDKIAIAEQLAKALVAQGKFDFTTEELEQLINVYMAMEKMSRERNTLTTTKSYLNELPPGALAPPPEVKEAPAKVPDRTRMEVSGNRMEFPVSRSMEIPGTRRKEKNDFRTGAGPNSGSGPKGGSSEVQPNLHGMASSSGGMLENLSDSDLQTLLQSFKELSNEEQMHLISYLRKLERTEPERVDKLRRYVDFDSLNGPSGQDYLAQSDDDVPDYGGHDDDDDFVTFRGSSASDRGGRNQHHMPASTSQQQRSIQQHQQQQQQKQQLQKQQHQQQQQHQPHQHQQQQKQPQQQLLQQKQQQQQQQQQITARSKDLQHPKGGNKLLVDSEDEDDYSYDDILRAASKNVSSVPHQSKTAIDGHDTSSNHSLRANANDAGSNPAPVSISDTQNLIANLMESLQKSVSDANSSKATSGHNAGGADYSPIMTIGSLAGGGRGETSTNALAQQGGSSGAMQPYFSPQLSQAQPRLQGAAQGLQNAPGMSMQQMGSYGMQSQSLGQTQGTATGQAQGTTPMGQAQGSQSMTQMQMQQQQPFGQQFMYQGQMFGANGAQQGQQQYGYGNFGYY